MCTPQTVKNVRIVHVLAELIVPKWFNNNTFNELSEISVKQQSIS